MKSIIITKLTTKNYKGYFPFYILALFLLACNQQPTEKNKVIFKTPKQVEGYKKMLLIPEGRFLMGTSDGPEQEQPLRTVQMPAFYMDETPVNYEEFKQYVEEGGEHTAYWEYPSYNQPQQPVTGLSWYQAIDFCNWRSKREGLKPAYEQSDRLDAWNYPMWHLKPQAEGYRLPTEAEFEYAARGGLVNKPFPWGDDFEDTFANYDTGKGIKVEGWWRLARVKEGKKNNYGLYTMSGNIWQWCNDWYGNYQQTDTINPQGLVAGTTKSLRGGSWGSISPEYLKVTGRNYSAPSNYNFDIGFRCVRSIYGDIPDTMKTVANFQHDFYRYPRVSEQPDVMVWDFSSQDFANSLAKFIGEHFPHSIYFQTSIDQQPKTTPTEIVADIMEVSKEYNVNPLFLTSIMISESGFGTCSFPRWYNNPMAYHWQNRLMSKGLPTYKDMPNRRNRKYKTLKHAFRAFCKGIRRPWYFKAARKNLDAFHLVYVGYRADEWMHTLSRVYRDVVNMRFDPHYPDGNAGKFIYTDWVER